ncbi:MAG: 7-carboxy-7-deazaguanine synthase QueE [Flavobacteriales bacterium]|nr:7-carboxy-7-deazaguanine synthase QueE [Flavobacteriales bacterium]|tara:strand:- start:812 stop:1444 length:633 start_codon:yes stop_codon:yes gene_type:complete
MNNTQKKLVAEGHMLPLMEAFYTIQGEGYHSGKSAFFLRIGGCDVGCGWCDVKESWNANLHPPTDINKMIDQVLVYPAKTVVITGGEPLMWNMQPLTDILHKNGMKVHLETSGAHQLSGKFDWICLSPKRKYPPKETIISEANELKVVIYSSNDFKWAEQFTSKCSSDCRLYLQPEWSKYKKMMPKIVDYVMNNPKWNISLQLHKYMNIP